jgi:hypothetical protein
LKKEGCRLYRLPLFSKAPAKPLARIRTGIETHCAQAAGHGMCDQAMGRTQLSPTSSTHADATHLRMLVGFGSFDWQFLSDFWHEKAGPRPQKAQQERLETIRSDQQSLVEISNMPNGE